MSTLNSKFDILRGWPNSSAVAEDWVVPTIADGDDNLKTGHWVRLDPSVPTVPTCLSQTRATKDSASYVLNATVDALDAAATVTVMAAPKLQALWGLIIEGQDEYSSAFSKRVTVLLGGGYIVRLWNSGVSADNMFTAANMAPGRPVGLVNGLIADCGLAVADGDDVGTTITHGTIIPMGYCVRVDSANSTCDIFVG